MPYIKSEDREKLVTKDSVFGSSRVYYEYIDNPGDLQYAIAVMVKSYLERKGLSYQVCNDLMGSLSGAQQELYRRVVAPYEDLKINENGDV